MARRARGIPDGTNDGTVRIYYRGLVKPRDYSGLLEGHPPLRCMWGDLGYHICIIDFLEITHFVRYNNLKGLSLLRVGATHPLFPTPQMFRPSTSMPYMVLPRPHD
jgi:hypothetical protein